MTLEDFISKRFADRLRQRRLLTLHDPDGRYREVVFGMADDHTTVLDCGGDLLDAREKSLESLAELGEDSTCKRRLALYVPVARSLEDVREGPLDDLAIGVGRANPEIGLARFRVGPLPRRRLLHAKFRSYAHRCVKARSGGGGARFHTSSANHMSGREMVEFLIGRGKFQCADEQALTPDTPAIRRH